MYNLVEYKRDICIRSFNFAKRIINLAISLRKKTSLYSISDQIIRSGTSIGANIEEAQNSSSKKEFIHTMTIALKEARETNYWLRLIVECKLISQEKMELLMKENVELIKIITTIVKNSKK
ncbi:MAG: hypothetical protein UR52_C0019G0007 [Candidatus Gottesmanbacteria bacterium GW2011_GWA1_34_13]|uniref:Four helix bundle protein n=1 Tax=Candidatus Gottesmanbacteria bacterium GW2011_GWA1_34_13 TaxID=1618434 RepID=A0A0G0B448_9BACT|nr:MAG: hypothetical protein UR52_C0019G0007 [Candidatus Gottesmanbacteria bacterium GW2011_GWA1_34_13]